MYVRGINSTSNMDRALVVLEQSESGREILREAGELAAGVDAHLDVLSLLSEEEYRSDIEELDEIAAEEGLSYEETTIDEYATQEGRNVAEDALGDLDLDYEVDGRGLDGDRRADLIVEAAEEKGCDHVFLTGVQRSPTGKAIFGDVAQSVILEFSGYTTLLMTSEE